MLNTTESAVLHFRSILVGELAPPAPRAFFGRDKLVERVVRLAENLEPTALVGAAGIGKTSIALAVLHHSRIKERFGENRRFIRCDQFPPSRAHFLVRLSKVIGAGIENPEDLTTLRPFLSSKEMLIILDNAESVLDPQGPDAREIYSMVDELCQVKRTFLLITSRITTVPQDCNRPGIPTLKMDAACDIFYGVCGDGERSSIVNDILQHLDFHALSIILLATAAARNEWDYDQLASKWKTQRAQMLQTKYNGSLAAVIELSLASPAFRKLGPCAHDLLRVVAFFPQGVEEKNIDWLFPTTSDRKNIFEEFCVLSLTYRSNGFVTMLAPIREYLGLRDPQSSPLLCAARDHYFTRLSVDLLPDKPGFEEARWIVSEDVNVEHLLDVSVSADPVTGGTWSACRHFMEHLNWHKPRETVLGSKIEALPDDHPFKSKCLFELSLLFGQLGNHAEQKRLLTHVLELERRLGDGFEVALTLRCLADIDRFECRYEEGIQRAREALKISERIGGRVEQMECLNCLAWLLFDNKQLGAAKDAASRATSLASRTGQEYLLCDLYRVLGKIHEAEGEEEEAIYTFWEALRTASSFGWRDEQFWAHLDLADLFFDKNGFDHANIHVKQAKLYARDRTYHLGRATKLQADIWYREGRLEDAKSEALGALGIFEKLEEATAVWYCWDLLHTIERATETRTASF